MQQPEEKVSVTIVLPAGRLPLDIMRTAQELAERHNLGVYLSTMQNLRLLEVPKSLVEEIKAPLASLGATFKVPGKFPIPRICVGKPHCNLGVVDTKELSDAILANFAHRPQVKAKIKIGIAACTLDCSAATLSDIGIIAGRNGFDVLAGGKGGPAPKVGRRIKRQIDLPEVLDTIETLIEFHDRKTGKKQRMYKLLSDPEFPFATL